MWIKHSNSAVGVIYVLDTDETLIARLLSEGGQEVDPPEPAHEEMTEDASQIDNEEKEQTKHVAKSGASQRRRR